MAQITGIKYTRDELIGIMETINNGAIHWGVVVGVDYTEDDRPKRIVVAPPADEGPEVDARPTWGIFSAGFDNQEIAITLNGVQDAIDRILRGDVQINSEIKGRITTDIGDIDGETADAIAQVACFKEIEFG